MLTLSEGTKGFELYCDAYRISLGFVLMQHGKMISYASRQPKVQERSIQHMTLSYHPWYLPLKIWRHYYMVSMMISILTIRVSNMFLHEKI